MVQGELRTKHPFGAALNRRCRIRAILKKAASTLNPVAGPFPAIASFAGMLVGILFARTVADFILMVFQINEHLAAIRNRGGM